MRNQRDDVQVEQTGLIISLVLQLVTLGAEGLGGALQRELDGGVDRFLVGLLGQPWHHPAPVVRGEVR